MNTPSPKQPQPQWGAQQAASSATGPKWARKRVAVPAAALLFLVGVGVGASGGETGADTSASPAPAPTVTRTVTAAPPADAKPAAAAPSQTPKAAKPATSAPPAEPVRITVPDFVGMGLQDAQDHAQAQGLFFLSSHDETGAGRAQVLDRNWTVCSQSPAAGTSVTADTTIDFGAVKLDETCS
ncbi:PASTA domain-containing protein [Streptomyces sp. NPDC095602]|uniref:PASTA domain-containing protein n=1 Tax=Streptomyces sp. NPDC095602 TaxID=3155819 RepID=UPI00331FA40B